jgi:hypothetical protein
MYHEWKEYKGPSGSINAGKFLSSCTTGGLSREAQLHGVNYWYGRLLGSYLGRRDVWFSSQLAGSLVS